MRGENMKFSLKRNEVLKEINLVKNVINQNSMKPILQNMLIEVQENGMVIEGSDLEVGVKYNLPVYNMEETGKTTIPADKLYSILNEAPEEEVVFLVEDEKHIFPQEKQILQFQLWIQKTIQNFQ